MTIQGHRLEFGDDDITLPIVVPDYFLMSLCDAIYYRMPTDFDADAALIIANPSLFIQRVKSAVLAKRPDWRVTHGRVSYYDPYHDFAKCRFPELTKYLGYSYQREYRIVFQPRRPTHAKFEPEFFTTGPMTEYATLLSA